MGKCQSVLINVKSKDSDRVGKLHNKELADVRKSYDPNSQAVIIQQQSWMEEEASHLPTIDDIGDKFKLLMSKFDSNSDDVVTREELRKGFREVGIQLDEGLFDKIFRLFDVDGDGTISVEEFRVAFYFLLAREKDKAEVAFQLFDVNRSGSISKSEFNAMVLSIIGRDILLLLRIDEWRQTFKDHLEKEFSPESLEFWLAISQLKKKKGEKGSIATSEADEIVQRFIVEDSPMQVNIQSNTREKIQDAINTSRKRNTAIPIRIFFSAQEEVKNLMVTDNFVRFKSEMKHSMAFADVVFENLPDKTHMTFADFKHWAANTPEVFTFIEQIQSEFKV